MDLSNVLKNYGLSDKEAKVYLACLSTGSSSAHKISKTAEIPRSTTYEVLESLQTLGLISSFQKKSIKYFTAESPNSIVAAAKEKAQLLEQALPNFLALYNNRGLKPTVKFYEGKYNLKVVFKEILNEAQNILVFSSAEDIVRVLGEDFTDFLRKRMAKKIFAKVIMRESPAALEMKRKEVSELRQVKLTPPTYFHHTIVFIWNKKVALLNIGEDFNVMIIEGEDTSLFFRSTFEFMWGLLE
jgi:HTH-type transcriptional regulator, sugar sensing transcriptional regulator